MNNLTTEYLRYIEAYFNNQCFVYENEPQDTLFSSMRYSLLAGGKRLRPVFVFDFLFFQLAQTIRSTTA
jgi:geranylgeranyl pyrophosphate synthase